MTQIRKTLSNPVNQANTSNTVNRTMAEARQQWDVLMQGGMTPAKLMKLGYAYTNNPYIQNQRTKKISSQPFSAKRDDIEKALADVENSEQILRQVSHSLHSNYPLVKLNAMYSNILTYRNYAYPKYMNHEDFDSEKYKEDRLLVSKWLDELQPKRTFKEIVEAVQWEGKIPYYMRDSRAEGNKGFDYVYLQRLPSDYVKIVGWNTASKFTIMFNFTYFWQAGTSPAQFPPIFQKYFEELNNFIPENQRRRPNPKFMPEGVSADTEFYFMDNTWFYWKTLPLDECFVFSQTESHPYQYPNIAGLFLQAKDLQDYSYLQQELLQLPLSGVVMGTMPMTKDIDGTTGTDNYAIGSEAFSFFTGMFNEAAPNGIQLFLSPATNHQFFKFDGDIVNNSQVVTNALQQFNATAGVGGLNSTTDKPNISQVKTQQTLESAYVEGMYEQFMGCVNTWFKNKLKLNYEWRFKIKGNQFKDASDIGTVKELVSLGQNYLMPELLSFYDLTLTDVESMQEEVIHSKIYEKFQVVQSAYTQSSQTRVNADTIEEHKSISLIDKGGRPAADLNNIESDGTAASIGNGTNTSDGREVMSLTHCVECGEPIDKNSAWFPFCSEECKIANDERLGGTL